jgi:hypothetical protein
MICMAIAITRKITVYIDIVYTVQNSTVYTTVMLVRLHLDYYTRVADPDP